jgi:hypothetical protein
MLPDLRNDASPLNIGRPADPAAEAICDIPTQIGAW